MKIKIIYFLFAFFLMLSCAKQIITTPLEFQKQLLSGTGGYQSTDHKWSLDSLSINGKDTALDKLKKLYFEKYESNTKYSDYDLKSGTWDISSIDKLKKIFKTYSINKPDSVLKVDTVFFDILSINSSKLKLRRTTVVNTIIYKIDYSFHLSN